MKKIVFLLLAMTLGLWSMTASELVKKMEKGTTSNNSVEAQLKMLLINSNGDTLERTMQLKTLDKGGESKALIEFLSPADVKGTKLLTYVHADKANEQWLYLPALKRVKRIVGSGQSGSFMGSEFTYEDFGKQGSDVYRYEELLQESTIDGVEYYLATRYPNSSDSAYSKQIIYVDKAQNLVRRVDYYDTKERHLKTATMHDYTSQNGSYRVGRIEMKNLQSGKATHILWLGEQSNAKLTDADFHKRVLER